MGKFWLGFLVGAIGTFIVEVGLFFWIAYGLAQVEQEAPDGD